MPRAQVLIGGASLGTGLALAVVAYYFSFAAPVLEPVSQGTAQGAALLLGLFGLDLAVDGAVLSSGTFSVAIEPGCTPIAPLLLFLGAVAGYPSGPMAKLKGALLGAIALTLLNWVRVITLFLLGSYTPEYLNITHVFIWQSLLVFAVVGLWVFWIQRYVEPPLSEARRSTLLEGLALAAALVLGFAVLWPYVADSYNKMLITVAEPLTPSGLRLDTLDMFIVFSQRQSGDALYQIPGPVLHFALVTCVAIALATPGMRLALRIGASAGAALLIGLSHVMVLAYFAYSLRSGSTSNLSAVYAAYWSIFPGVLAALWCYFYWYRPARRQVRP